MSFPTKERPIRVDVTRFLMSSGENGAHPRVLHLTIEDSYALEKALIDSRLAWHAAENRKPRPRAKKKEPRCPR